MINTFTRILYFISHHIYYKLENYWVIPISISCASFILPDILSMLNTKLKSKSQFSFALNIWASHTQRHILLPMPLSGKYISTSTQEYMVHFVTFRKICGNQISSKSNSFCFLTSDPVCKQVMITFKGSSGL